MKQNFIKFRKESLQLARIFESANDNSFDTNDIAEGTLAIGTYGNGKYLAMGWLRGMALDKNTGKVLYEVVNAVEDEVTVFIEDAKRVNSRSVPLLAAKIVGSNAPAVGRAFACNGEFAKFNFGDDFGIGLASTEFIYRLEPLFKETK